MYNVVETSPRIISILTEMLAISLGQGIQTGRLEDYMLAKQFLLDLHKTTFGDQKDVPPKDWQLLLQFTKE